MNVESLQERISGASALVVVDMQNDFLHDDGFLARRGVNVSHSRSIVGGVNSLIVLARAAGVLVVYLKEVFSEGTSLPNLVAQWGQFGTVVAEGRWGSEFYDGLETPQEGDAVVTKWNYDGFSDTRLDLLLRTNRVATLVFAGVSTNVCVETTARQAYVKGYGVVVLSDLCAASTRGEHEGALHNLGTYFGAVSQSQAVRDLWKVRRNARGTISGA